MVLQPRFAQPVRRFNSEMDFASIVIFTFHISCLTAALGSPFFIELYARLWPSQVT